MPTLAELQNPYASLNANIDAEEELSKHAYVAKLQNPYAAIEFFGEWELEEDIGGSASGAGPRKQLKLPYISAKASVTKVSFCSRARAIFVPYEPMRGKSRVLRPEFRNFIRENENKSGPARASILAELERFDLSSMGALNPHLNREGDSIVETLKKISRKYPS